MQIFDSVRYKKNIILYLNLRVLVIIVLFCCMFAEVNAQPEIFCGAEILSNDNKYFISPFDSTDIFQYNHNRSEQFTHTGFFSVKLTRENPFGLTYRIRNVKKGDHYRISVWRYGNDDSGALVVSDTTSKIFYLSERYAYDRDNKGWDLLKIFFTVPSETENNDLIVYVWYPGEDTVWFDDLSIEKVHEDIRSSGEIYCNAEKINHNGSCFLSPWSNMIMFRNNNTRSDEKAHSGQYSVILTEEKPFGMTYELKKVKKGERYHASIWRYSTDDNGILVAADKTSKRMYISGKRIFKREESGWELLAIDFEIPKKMHKKSIKIFAWNQGGQPVFFDDLKIVKVTEDKETPFTIHCDAEHLSPDGQSFISLENNTVSYGNARYRSDERARSGKYSVKLSNDSQYGFSYKLKNVQKDEFYRISVWRYSPDHAGHIVAADKTSEKYYVTGKRIYAKDENGWEQLRLDLEIPPHIHNEDIKIFIWNPHEYPAYFDDLWIEKLDEKPYPVYDTGTLKIKIDAAGMRKLLLKREEAFKKGILETSDDDEVEAVILWEGKEYRAEVRLKGDWLDHLNGRKWSMRIKMKNDGAWKNMRNFSIQTPLSRDFLNEWIFHELLKRENILTTRYGFIPVEINGESVGVYAYEEHFDRHLPEYNSRRESPILKFDEEGFWKMQHINLNAEEKVNLPVFEASEILPFKLNRTKRSHELSGMFVIARNMLKSYRAGNLTPGKIFNIEKLAKYYALINIAKAYHCLIWHNHRYYYNPVLSELEPVAFDSYTHDGIFNFGRSAIFGDNDIDTGNISNDLLFLYYPFTDTSFIDFYIEYLAEFSDSRYISDFINAIDNRITEYETLLSGEFPFYSYDPLFLFNNAENIRQALPGFRKRIENNSISLQVRKGYSAQRYDSIADTLFLKYLVKANMSIISSDTSRIRIVNYCPYDIFISGTGANRDSVDYNLDTEYRLGSFCRNRKNITDMDVPAGCNYFFFRTNESGDMISLPVNKWGIPEENTPLMELISNSDFPENKYFQIENDSTVIFKKGSYELDERIVIPEGYVVKIAPGTEIDMTGSSMIISYSPLIILGSKTEPVIISSSDGTSMGVTVLQAKGQSVITNAVFDQINNIDYKGWRLTGALNFYESDVIITGTVFRNNRSEDALNIIRSDFEIANCEFDNIFYDAFDSDFSNGNISNTRFRDIANDAMDFSGSNVKISSCKVFGAGDKGISGGENSDILIKNILIEDSNVGIASKDLSVVRSSYISLKDCNYGYIALKKKPEYGPAVITVDSAEILNTVMDYYIETGSDLILDGDTIPGDKKNVAKKFYLK